MRLTEPQARSLFILAGFDVLAIRPLPDGYGYAPSDPRYFETLPREVWWFVKTIYGWIEIGWRHRVISIDWRDTGMAVAQITPDDVTKDRFYVHAWSEEKALEYLKALRAFMDAMRHAGRLGFRVEVV